MDWVFDNINLLLIVAGTVAYWLTQRREARKQREGEAPPGDLRPPVSPEADDRPITSPEELRRRILEQLGIPAEEPATPPPLSAMLREPPPPLPMVEPEPPRLIVKPSAPPPQAPVATRAALVRTALRSPGSLREAIVLRELLGAPVGLRSANHPRH